LVVPHLAVRTLDRCCHFHTYSRPAPSQARSPLDGHLLLRCLPPRRSDDPVHFLGSDESAHWCRPDCLDTSFVPSNYCSLHRQYFRAWAPRYLAGYSPGYFQPHFLAARVASLVESARCPRCHCHCSDGYISLPNLTQAGFPYSSHRLRWICCCIALAWVYNRVSYWSCY
jgi:hypothetical protein